jgi:DNA polymerase-3 subunit delta
LAALRAELDPTGLNTTVVENARGHLAEVQAACCAAGFFGTTRLVVAHDLFTAPRSGRRGKSADDDEVANLLSLVPATTRLIVVEAGLDVGTERAARRRTGELDVERHEVPRGPALLQWVAARATRYGSSLGGDAAEQLLEALFPGSWQAVARRDDLPPDLYRLDSEVAKLCVAAGTAGQVSAELVRELTPGAEAESIWGLTDAIASGDQRRAVVEVERALAHGAAPEALLGQLVGHFEGLAAFHAAGPRPDPAAVAAATGLSEGRLRQVSRVAGRFPAARTNRSLDALRSLDADAKQGRVEAADTLVALAAALASGAVTSRTTKAGLNRP